ncbi:uncharacterized protein RAG0_07635 [Rhynchosporium agropyri]|uniref:Clr5 domain-containing protein n=1 Tax=Rhynchosporium agropyri TaxID=914238 RepID=A0A1E1KMD4_9HELO|nr:uncharacterized protein RAG0_07635 [Rhynchosporium agropyri]
MRVLCLTNHREAAHFGVSWDTAQWKTLTHPYWAHSCLRIIVSKWDLDREQIKKLYFDKGMKLNDVILIMKDEGFITSRKSYERHLNALELRKRRGLDSLVLIKGSQLSKLDVVQATSRCFVPSSVLYSGEDHELPPGVTVITPTTEGYMVSIQNRQLPYIYFLNQIPYVVYVLPQKKESDGIEGDLRQLIFMSPQILKKIISAIATGHGGGNCRGLARVHELLSSTLPVEEDEHSLDVLRYIFSGNNATRSVELLKITVYLLSNKIIFARSQHLIYDALLEWFQMVDNYLFLRSILLNKMPTNEAFSEGMFSSAINAGDRKIVNQALKCGMCSNAFLEDRSGIVTVGEYDIVELLLGFHADLNFQASWSDRPSIHGRSTPLGIAARNGNMPIARLLIAKGVSIHTGANLGFGVTALHHAVLNGHIEAATMLLDMGADANAQGSSSGSPLECAIIRNAISIVDLLLQRGALVNDLPKPGRRTPLQLAATLDDPDPVKRLLRLGAYANAPAPSCFDCNENIRCADIRTVGTALKGAAANGSVHICQTLLDSGANINAAPSICTWKNRKKGMTSLVAAIRSGNCDLVKLFMNCGADVDDERGCHTALEAASSANYPDILQTILSINPRLDTNPCVVVETKNIHLIVTFFEAGADMNAVQKSSVSDSNMMQDYGAETQWSPPSKAVAIGDKDCVKILLRLGAWPNPEPGKGVVIPVVEAVYHADISMINMLLAAGANLDMQEDYVARPRDSGADINICAALLRGRTSLQAAVESRHTELIQFLIEEGADPDSPAGGYFGVTALQAAGYNGDKSCIIMLLSKVAHLEVDDSGEIGSTSLAPNALNGAAFFGHLSTVRLLLASGAEGNAPVYGQTALQAAASGGYLHIADVLVKSGADVNAVGSEIGGQSALECAASYGRIDMLKFLLNDGPDITSDLGHARFEKVIDLAIERQGMPRQLSF